MGISGIVVCYSCLLFEAAEPQLLMGYGLGEWNAREWTGLWIAGTVAADGWHAGRQNRHQTDAFYVCIAMPHVPFDNGIANNANENAKCSVLATNIVDVRFQRCGSIILW